MNKAKTMRRPARPEEMVPYLVNPSKIDWNLFKNEREDESQEKMRKLILEARTMVDKYPKEYRKPFKTMMIEMLDCEEWKSVSELNHLAWSMGDHMADLVEQSLVWAQRITNGEPWEDVCNKADTAKRYRLVRWRKNNWKLQFVLVGGSCKRGKDYPASYVHEGIIDYNYNVRYTIPLIVL